MWPVGKHETSLTGQQGIWTSLLSHLFRFRVMPLRFFKCNVFFFFQMLCFFICSSGLNFRATVVTSIHLNSLCQIYSGLPVFPLQVQSRKTSKTITNIQIPDGDIRGLFFNIKIVGFVQVALALWCSLGHFQLDHHNISAGIFMQCEADSNVKVYKAASAWTYRRLELF